MALTRFINAYALVSEIDGYMLSSIPWQNFDVITKEAWITAVSIKIDNLLYEGLVDVDGQPLKFPRQFNSYRTNASDNIYDISEQTRTLIRAVAYQIEFDLNRNGIGFTDQSIGDQSVTERQETICRETLSVLQYYIKSDFGVYQ